MTTFMRDIDLKNLRARFSTKKGEMTITVAGLPAAVYARLALVGAIALLERSADPKGRWERIRSGNFGRPLPKKLPPIIYAIARVTKEPVGDCWDSWRQMTKAEKATLRKNKEIRKALIDLEPEEESHEDQRPDVLAG